MAKRTKNKHKSSSSVDRKPKYFMSPKLVRYGTLAFMLALAGYGGGLMLRNYHLEPQYSMTRVAGEVSGVSEEVQTDGTFIPENPKAIKIMSDRVTINWTSMQPASSRVVYWPVGAGERSNTPEFDRELPVTSHGVTLYNLQPGTTYNYSAQSRDASGVVHASPTPTFTTLK